VAGKGVTTSATVTELAKRDGQIYGKPKPGFPTTQRITAGERDIARGTATIVQASEAGTEAAPKDMHAEKFAEREAALEKYEYEDYLRQYKNADEQAAHDRKMVREKEVVVGEVKGDAWKGLGTGLRIGVPIAVGGIVAALSISVIWGSLKSVSVDFAAMPEEQQYAIIAIIGICIFAVVAYLTWKYMGEH